MKIRNLKDLKDYLNTLEDDQLTTKAYVQYGDGQAKEIVEADILGEDYYKTDDGDLELLSTFKPYDNTDVIENYEVLLEKAVFLYLPLD